MLLRWFKDIHWPVVVAFAGLVTLSLLFVFSASLHDSGNYMEKHMMWVLIATATLFLVPFLGYRTFLSISYLLYVISMIFLVWVLLAGESRLGAQRWIMLGPIVLQPSEFAKLSTLLALANFLGSNPIWDREGKVLLTATGLTVLPVLLIMKQPDLGSSIIFIPILAVLLFLWGIRYRILAFAVGTGLLLLPLGWNFLKAYQQKRILVFLDPQKDPLGAGYTALQSRIAVGSGGLFGKGYLAGTQSQLQFVPEHHTDFIFCVIGEELGYMGALLLLGLYGLLFSAIFLVMEKTTDIKAKLLAAGVLALIFSQVFINMGMSIGLLPITGITLPFISYGGSSLLMSALALGLILSIYKERSIF